MPLLRKAVRRYTSLKNFIVDTYKETFDTWNKVAKLYQEKFMDLDLYDDTYDTFCAELPIENATILEIGCGPGNITKYLLNKRPDFRIEGIDISPNMIELAKAKPAYTPENSNRPARKTFFIPTLSAIDPKG